MSAYVGRRQPHWGTAWGVVKATAPCPFGRTRDRVATVATVKIDPHWIFTGFASGLPGKSLESVKFVTVRPSLEKLREERPVKPFAQKKNPRLENEGLFLVTRDRENAGHRNHFRSDVILAHRESLSSVICTNSSF